MKLTILGALSASLALAASVAGAAVPVPVAGCRAGGLDLREARDASAMEAAARRAFPRAVLIRSKRGPVATTEVREGADRVLVLSRDGPRLLGVELLSARFVLADGVSPGAKVVAAERALGSATLEQNPTTGDRELRFSDPDRRLEGFDGAGCSLWFNPGPGPRATARIRSIELRTP